MDILSLVVLVLPTAFVSRVVAFNPSPVFLLGPAVGREGDSLFRGAGSRIRIAAKAKDSKRQKDGDDDAPFFAAAADVKADDDAPKAVVDSGGAADNTFLDELKELAACTSLAFGPLFQSDDCVKPEDIVLVCDEIDSTRGSDGDGEIIARHSLTLNEKLDLRRRSLMFRRYELLVKMMRKDYESYVATASFLSPSRIPRDQLPNVQDIPYDEKAEEELMMAKQRALNCEEGLPLVADCELEDMVYKDSVLDKTLLSIFRKLVEKNTGGVTSDKEGIAGLLDQGRTFMLQPYQTSDAQHEMVYNTLGGLMTPVLPPFYRIFMSGIVPKVGSDWDGKQLGPWFYAPFLTSVVTPTFFAFLVGPSAPNRRKDGNVGGLLVEKCKFLQESGCKGLCLHQCKLPAQQFFAEELGLPLTVSPNFVTQECQWSFGEEPLPPDEDPSFPKGCLVGCESRKAVVDRGSNANLCSS